MHPESFSSSLFMLSFLTGLAVGVSHCLGMCGPIVVAISMGKKEGTVFWPLSLYHAGRIITYSLIGGMMGFAGSFAVVSEFMKNFKPAILFGTGLLIVIMGLAMTGVIPKIRFFAEDSGESGFLAEKIKSLITAKRTMSYFFMGLWLGLLPCGPVYAALLAAAGSGAGAGGTTAGVLSGMGIMACFGIGTAPALFLLGKLSSLKMLASRVIIYRIAGIIVILSGVRFIYRALA